MAVRDIFTINRKTFFNPGAWINWEQLSAQNRYLWSVLRGLFYPPVAKTSRTFEQAMQDFGLQESDIVDGLTTYRTFAFIFVVFGLGALFYSVYLFAHASFGAAFLSISVAALFFSQAFKYDFWALQMRRRHLGLTFADWKRQYLGD